MKKESNLIHTRLQAAAKAYDNYRFRERDLLQSIQPYIENDTDVEDRDICIDRLEGDGFALMLGENGVPVRTIIGLISKLKTGDKIKLSELNYYL